MATQKPVSGARNAQKAPAQAKQPAISSLVALGDGFYCDRARTRLYRYIKWIDRETGDEQEHYELIVTRWGMPVLEAVYQDDPRDDEKIDSHTYYIVRCSGLPFIPAQRFTHFQIEHGVWAATFGIAIAKRAQQQMYANVIFEQRLAFCLPLAVMPEHTGLQRDPADGLYHYVLRTGEHLHQDGSITGNHAPLARYSFDAESHTSHVAAWQHYEPLLPRPSLQGITDLFQWDMKVDPTGNRLLLHLFSYRALISSLIPMKTAIVAAAKDGTDITDGGAGSGKTSAIDHARGVDGPTPYQAEQDAAFHGSITSIETRIDPLRDTLVSVSDFHFNSDPVPELEARHLADKFDSFIRSVADNGEVRPRGTRAIKAATGTHIKAGLVFDGEKLPDLFLSRLRRAIILQFERGTLDIERVKTDWWETQGIHTATGRALIQWTLQRVNTNLSEFVRDVQGVEQRFADYLFANLIQERPAFDQAIGRSLASNYARLLTPEWMIKQTIGRIDNATRQQLFLATFRSLLAFVDMLMRGGPSAITPEWMITALKMLFQDGIGHALAMDNSPLHGDESDLLGRWGYERTLLADHPWKPRGVHLANLSEDGGTLWYIPDILLEKIRARALRDKLAFPYNAQTFPALLVSLGIAEKARAKNLWRERFNGALEYRLRVSQLLLYSPSMDSDQTEGTEGTEGTAVYGVASQADLSCSLSHKNLFPLSNIEGTEKSDRGNSYSEDTSRSIPSVPSVPSVPSSESDIQECDRAWEQAYANGRIEVIPGDFE